MQMLEESRPPIETPVEQLEQDVVGLLSILFQHKRQHPVILDGKEVGVEIGCKPTEDYFHYINGHTLEVDSGANCQEVHLHVPHLCRQHHTPRNGVAQGQQGHSHRHPRLYERTHPCGCG